MIRIAWTLLAFALLVPAGQADVSVRHGADVAILAAVPGAVLLPLDPYTIVGASATSAITDAEPGQRTRTPLGILAAPGDEIRVELLDYAGVNDRGRVAVHLLGDETERQIRIPKGGPTQTTGDPVVSDGFPVDLRIRTPAKAIGSLEMGILVTPASCPSCAVQYEYRVEIG